MTISRIYNKSNLKRSYSLSIEKRRIQLANSEFEEKDIGDVVDSELKLDKHITENMKESKPDGWYNNNNTKL